MSKEKQGTAVGLFAAVVKEALAVQTKTGGLWVAMVYFAISNEVYKAGDYDEMKAEFASHEKLTKESKDVALQKIGAYRSAKSVVMASMEYGVNLVDKNGAVRGKTEVEKDIREQRSEETTPLQRFQTSVNRATGQMDKVKDAQEIAAAYVLAKQLFQHAELLAKKRLGPKIAINNDFEKSGEKVIKEMQAHAEGLVAAAAKTGTEA